MSPSPESFAARRLGPLLAARNTRLGQPLQAMSSTGSTMDDAMSAARSGAPEGATFLAEHQTRGRGRRGRSWSSYPGQSLTFSVVLHPRMRPAEAPALALVAGLAIRSVVAALGIAPVLVKWPNDVIVGKRKIAGVLVESHLRGDQLAAVVVGIGVNVTTRDFGPELRDQATSLALEGVETVDRVELFVNLLADLEQRIDSLSARGFDGIVDELRQHDALCGVPVRVGNVTGIGAGLDETGALLVSDAAGTTHALAAGSVVLL